MLPAGFAEGDDAEIEARRLFQRADKDKDGRLSSAEMPVQFGGLFKKIDGNKDGFDSIYNGTESVGKFNPNDTMTNYDPN